MGEWKDILWPTDHVQIHSPLCPCQQPCMVDRAVTISIGRRGNWISKNTISLHRASKWQNWDLHPSLWLWGRFSPHSLRLPPIKELQIFNTGSRSDCESKWLLRIWGRDGRLGQILPRTLLGTSVLQSLVTPRMHLAIFVCSWLTCESWSPCGHHPHSYPSFSNQIKTGRDDIPETGTGVP